MGELRKEAPRDKKNSFDHDYERNPTNGSRRSSVSSQEDSSAANISRSSPRKARKPKGRKLQRKKSKTKRGEKTKEEEADELLAEIQSMQQSQMERLDSFQDRTSQTTWEIDYGRTMHQDT